MQIAITISREFGSGGREIGIALAKKMNIPFYDKELVTLAGQHNGLSPKILAQHEESFSPRQSFAGMGVGLFAYYRESISDQIYGAQCKVIRELAAKGPCVIVGRCANPVLDGASINVFIYDILSIDNKRKKYYEYYTDKTWGAPAGYNLCINIAPVSIEDCADIIAAYAVRYSQEAK